MRELIERLRVLEQDHEPDGWPAVRMRDITALLDALDAAQEHACVKLVADIRFACGDNGRRMQPELVEFIRELAADAARYRWLRDEAFPDSDSGLAVSFQEMNSWGKWCTQYPSGVGLDAAIDSARTKEAAP